jgi:hypothetical protein
MTTAAPVPYRVGQWLPTDHVFLVRWLEAMVEKTQAQPRALPPVIADLRQLIETDPEIFMLFNQMFEQVPKRPPYDRDPCGRPQVRDYRHMLQLLNSIMIHAPESQPYSIVHMLANDDLAPLFDGATVYQAYLSPLSYHRWHSPVSGTITKAYVRDGTYYAEAASHGFDPSGPNDSQSYITEVATRALVFIQADNPDIGLMCMLAVGMAEVSSCQITVYEGQRVRKGDQIGMFHYGGSTHCLIFRPGVKLEFDQHGQKPGLHGANIHVNARIDTVSR